jgi:hypothetical protein
VKEGDDPEVAQLIVEAGLIDAVPGCALPNEPDSSGTQRTAHFGDYDGSQQRTSNVQVALRGAVSRVTVSDTARALRQPGYEIDMAGVWNTPELQSLCLKASCSQTAIRSAHARKTVYVHSALYQNCYSGVSLRDCTIRVDSKWFFTTPSRSESMIAHARESCAARQLRPRWLSQANIRNEIAISGKITR